MNERAYKQAVYQSFFNELESIEKSAMLRKEAIIAQSLAKGWNRIAGSNIGKGTKTLIETAPTKTKGLWGKQFRHGVRKATEAGGGEALGKADKLRAGLGQAMKSPSAQAAAAGAGGLVAGGAGLAGVGYLAGRGRSRSPQPPE